MKRVLIVAYYFPPLGLAGVNRPLQLYKHLSEFGWEPHILTVKPVAYAAYEPELLSDLDTSRIHRSDDYWLRRAMYPAARVLPLAAWREQIRNSETGKRLFSLLNTGTANEPFPDPLFQWMPHAVKLGRELIRDFQFDLILSTSPPITAHLVAQELHQRSRIPWIADFRDYWGPLPIESQFSDMNLRLKAHETIQSFSQSAKSIVAINTRISMAVNASTIIPNAYDIDTSNCWRAPSNECEPFVVGLLGNMTPLSWSPLAHMLKAYRNIAPATSIDVIHVGDDLMQAGQREFGQAGIETTLRSYGRRSRAETVDILNAAHALFIGFESGTGDHLLPTRLFDMLGSGRPILAASGQSSELREFTKDVSYLSWYDVLQPDNGARKLAKIIDSYAEQSDQGVAFAARRKESEKFSSRVMTERFASLFNEICDGT